MTHIPRLTRELRGLLASQRVAALGTLDGDGFPSVSMVPFAIEVSLDCFVIHVSGLAAHTGNLLARPHVSLMVMQSPVDGEPVHALPRVSLDGVAQMLAPDSPDLQRCRATYLKRFPEAEPMTQLGDFCWVAITLLSARQVAGFGAARSLTLEDLRPALALE